MDKIKLSVVGPDRETYAVPFRIARTQAYWDSQALLGQIVGILTQEKLGIEVEYLHCDDETSCTFGTTACVGWQDYECHVVATREQAAQAFAEGRKLREDPLADLMFLGESFLEYMTPEAFEGTEMDYDRKPSSVLGPSGYTSRDAIYVFPEVVDEAWRLYQMDLESFRSFAPRETRALMTPPQVLIDDGIVAEELGCTSEIPAVAAAMAKHTSLGWTCNSDSWWVNPACAAFGDNWTTECVVIIEDDWGYSKDALYKSAAVSEVPVAKLMVGYDPWWELVYYKNYNTIFTWWDPDATVTLHNPRRVNLAHGTDFNAEITIKVGYDNALRADPRLKQFVSGARLNAKSMQELMRAAATLVDEGYEAGEETAHNFYQKVACDWLRSNEDVWQAWLPSAKSCLTGQFFDAATERCVACAAGRYGTIDDKNMVVCQQCEPGTYAEFMGATECLPCQKGSFVAERGVTMCELCPRGQYSAHTGQSTCDVCDPGAAVPRTTDSRGMMSAEECKCGEGFFESANGGPCVPCPEGMTCKFGSSVDNFGTGIDIPEVDPGYFTQTAEPLSVYRCSEHLGAERCPGGRPQRCGAGRVGMVCERCPDGQAPDGDAGECSDCNPASTGLLVVGIPLGILVLTLLLFKLANDPIQADASNTLMASVVVGIVVTTLQSFALFPNLSITWREQGDFFQGLKFFTGDPNGLRLECAMTGAPDVLFAFRCLLPVVCVVSVLAVWGCSAVCGGCIPFLKGLNFTAAHNSMGQLFHVLFIAIAVLVVQPLRCYQHPNAKSSMSLYPEVLCWETDMHTTMVVLGLLVGLFFVLPFLVACLLAMIRAPSARDPVYHYAKWRFLIYRFRPDAWWWGICFLLRQLALAFSACVPAEQPHWQTTYVALVTVVYMCAVCLYWPWKTALLNWIDFVSVTVLNFVIISAGAFAPAAAPDELGSFVSFHFVLLGCFTVAVLAVLGLLVLNMFQHGFRSSFIAPWHHDRHQVTAAAWKEFLQISTSVDYSVVHRCINTFNEYDLGFLMSAMGAFQSLTKEFGQQSARRLTTTSHSKNCISDLASEVSSQRRSCEQGDLKPKLTVVEI